MEFVSLEEKSPNYNELVWVYNIHNNDLYLAKLNMGGGWEISIGNPYESGGIITSDTIMSDLWFTHFCKLPTIYQINL